MWCSTVRPVLIYITWNVGSVTASDNQWETNVVGIWKDLARKIHLRAALDWVGTSDKALRQMCKTRRLLLSGK